MLSSNRWLFQPSLRAFPAILALIALLVPSTSWARSVLLRDGVVLELDDAVAYVMTPEGAIDAIDLYRGTSLWSTREAAKPLAVAGDVLVAQGEARAAGVLDVVALDRRQQGARRQAAEVELPDGVWAPIDDGPTSVMRTFASLKGGDVYVSWRALRTKADGPLQGYLPIEEAAPKSARRLQGLARLDLAAGTATAMPSSKVAEFPAPRTLDMLRNKPLKGVAGRQYTSADGRHILASERVADNGEWNRYRWRLYERDTGQLVGTMRHHVAVTPFVVVGGTLIHESRPHGVRRGEEIVDRPLEIRAIDLASGQELWAKTVRPTEFAGPFAP